MKKYLIDNFDIKGNNAGPKARADVRYFLHQIGFEDLVATNITNLIQKEDILWRRIFSKIEQLTQEDIVIIQYPIYSKILMQLIIKRIKKQGSRCYLIIHDLESLRIFKGRIGFHQGEVKLINQTNGAIVHNQVMLNKMRQMGVTSNLVPLELFDYRTPTVIPDHQVGFTVAFAGNLMKAHFLSKWKNNVQLDLYGSPIHLFHSKSITLYGSVNADLLPGKLTESYGLVWDGRSLETCNGMYGDYLRYNNPHKFSLYLASGMPVITWKKAAIAKFIEKNQVGLIVDHLSEVQQALKQITKEQYDEMQERATQIALNVRKGRYIKQAVETLLTVGQ